MSTINKDSDETSSSQMPETKTLSSSEDINRNIGTSSNIERNDAYHEGVQTVDETISHRKHISSILRITSPIILAEVFQNTLPLVDIAFIGRLPGKDDLAAAALATVWFNLWNTAMIGYCTAVDTFLSQSYGAGELKTFSLWTGMSLMIVLATTIPISGAVALCAPIMKLFGQDHALSEAAGLFCYCLIPGLFPYFIFKVLIKYLQTQDILYPGVFIGIFANLFNVLANWLLIFKWGYGLIGAPWATTLTRLIELTLIVMYMYMKRSTTLVNTWPCFSTKNFQRQQLLTFGKLAIAGMFSIAAEAWSFEITTIMAGLLGKTQLNAHIITLNVATFVFLSFPFAIGIASSIRVGQLTGEGRSSDAKRSSFISLLLTLVIQGLLIAILIPCRHVLGNMFSIDLDVSDLVSKLIPISCYFMIGDAIQANVGGTLRGLGQQKLVLALNIIGFWMLGLSIGALLTFVADLDVYGLWWGMNIGIYVSSIVGVLILRFFIDWEHETVKAKERITTEQVIINNVDNK
mmetsp:Transcript_17876/g.20646  ORF Transcript_17876/g.20646 Transcript_17876/m.20646 type:complete len:519 (-) Transcript_17876:709-2265(-)